MRKKINDNLEMETFNKTHEMSPNLGSKNLDEPMSLLEKYVDPLVISSKRVESYQATLFPFAMLWQRQNLYR